MSQGREYVRMTRRSSVRDMIWYVSTSHRQIFGDEDQEKCNDAKSI
jgi:hypothetical protein